MPFEVDGYRVVLESLDGMSECESYMSELEGRWCLRSDVSVNECSIGEMVRNVMVEGLSMEGGMESLVTLSEEELSIRLRSAREEVMLLYHVLKRQEGYDGMMSNRISNLMGMVTYSERMLHCMHRMRRIGMDGVNQILVSPTNFERVSMLPMPMPMDAEVEGEASTTQFQSLLLYLLDKAQEQGYYKYNGDVYNQILVSGRKTYAWRRVYGIKDFIYDVTDKETNRDQWKNLTHGKNNASSAVEYLASCRDVQFPELKKDRGVFAFRNGLYFARLDSFWCYGSQEAPPAGVIAAANYIDQEYPMELCTPGTEEDWYETIPTPNLQKIMDYQEFPRDVCEWLYAFLGRLMYDVNEKDGWQVIPFCKGQASSGKSTILLKVAKNFYDKVDVGVLSNNIEKKFGIGAFCEKYMFVAPEIKGDLQLEQAEFQSIVSGEDVQVAIKHSTAQSVLWKTPGILAGNEVPNWTDNSGSITRRIVIWDFVKSVENGEMDLGEKLNKELAYIILKCNRAYHDKVRKVGKDNIWQHLPQYFVDRRAELLACTNTLVSFIKSDQVILGKQLHVPFDMFRSAFNQYCQDNHLVKPKINREYWFYPFRQFGLVEDMASARMYRGSMMTTKWVLGIDIRSTEAEITM